MIPQVAVSEQGTAQTIYMLKPASVVYVGLRVVAGQSVRSVGKLQISIIAEESWKGSP